LSTIRGEGGQEGGGGKATRLLKETSQILVFIGKRAAKGRLHNGLPRGGSIKNRRKIRQGKISTVSKKGMLDVL